MSIKTKISKKGRSRGSRKTGGRGFVKFRKIFSVVVLFCFLVFSLSAVGYVIFVRTVAS
jgi:hypothetical protein